jgi:hypothetical protein
VSDCVVLVVVELVNGNSGPVTVGVETDSDLFIGVSTLVDVYNINGDAGFRIERVTHMYSFLLWKYPLIRDVSTYWFGSFVSRDAGYWINFTFSLSLIRLLHVHGHGKVFRFQEEEELCE